MIGEATAPAWSAEVGGVRLRVGAGQLARLGEVARSLGGSRVLLVSDQGVSAAGHLDAALGVLREASVELCVFDQIDENPTAGHVAAGRAVATDFAPDLIVALGGGSVMDCAKAINLVHINGGDIGQYRGYNQGDLPLLLAVGVPTTAGTGSEAQSYAIIGREGDHRKMACGDESALFDTVILDPCLAATCPPAVAAASGIDAVAHAIESHVSAASNPISRIYSLAAWRQLHANLEAAWTGDLRAVEETLVAAHLAGAAIEQSMLGAAHGLSNPLTAEFGVTHGIALAILLPHVIRYNRSAVEGGYRELAAAAGLDTVEPAEALARRVEALRGVAELPTRLRDLEIDRETLATLAAEAVSEWTTGNNPHPAAARDLAAIYDAAW